MDKDAYERFVENNYDVLVEGFLEGYGDQFEEFCMREFSEQAKDEED